MIGRQLTLGRELWIQLHTIILNYIFYFTTAIFLALFGVMLGYFHAICIILDIQLKAVCSSNCSLIGNEVND